MSEAHPDFVAIESHMQRAIRFVKPWSGTVSFSAAQVVGGSSPDFGVGQLEKGEGVITHQLDLVWQIVEGLRSGTQL